MYTCEMPACEMYAYGMHACEMHVYEMYAAILAIRRRTLGLSNIKLKRRRQKAHKSARPFI